MSWQTADDAAGMWLQWGPVVVTGIRRLQERRSDLVHLFASMGSGRGDRNQVFRSQRESRSTTSLQWGPVVVTGISGGVKENASTPGSASMGSGRGDRNQRLTNAGSLSAAPTLQWGPVVVTGISRRTGGITGPAPVRFNGVRSW